MKRLVLITVFLTILVGAASSAMAGAMEEQLLAAAESGNADVVRTLLSRGADVNAKDSDGDTALLIAIKRFGNADVVRVLLDKGADINREDRNHRTPLWLAVSRNKADVVRALLDKGVNINATSVDYETPLMTAAFFGNEDVVRVLLEKNADVNARDDKGETALIKAVIMSNTGVVRILIDKDVDLTIKDNSGNTALAYAEMGRKKEIAQMLQNAVNITFSQGGAADLQKNQFAFSGWTATVQNNGTKPVDHIKFRLSIIGMDNNPIYSQIHTIDIHLEPRDVKSVRFPLKQKVFAPYYAYRTYSMEVIRAW